MSLQAAATDFAKLADLMSWRKKLSLAVFWLVLSVWFYPQFHGSLTSALIFWLLLFGWAVVLMLVAGVAALVMNPYAISRGSRSRGALRDFLHRLDLEEPYDALPPAFRKTLPWFIALWLSCAWLFLLGYEFPSSLLSWLLFVGLVLPVIDTGITLYLMLLDYVLVKPVTCERLSQEELDEFDAVQAARRRAAEEHLD